MWIISFNNHQPNSIVISVTHEESGWGVGLLQFC